MRGHSLLYLTHSPRMSLRYFVHVRQQHYQMPKTWYLFLNIDAKNTEKGIFAFENMLTIVKKRNYMLCQRWHKWKEQFHFFTSPTIIIFTRRYLKLLLRPFRQYLKIYFWFVYCGHSATPAMWKKADPLRSWILRSSKVYLNFYDCEGLSKERAKTFEASATCFL